MSKGKLWKGRLISGCTDFVACIPNKWAALKLAEDILLRQQKMGEFPSPGAAHPPKRRPDFRVPVSRGTCISMKEQCDACDLTMNKQKYPP